MFQIRGLRVLRSCVKNERLQFLHTQPKKRFYKNVSLVQSNGKFEINLDHRKLKTPLGSPLQISSEALAQAVANEWMSQKEVINLNQMHINGLCNTSLDNPGNTGPAQLVQSILAFLETDTVLFYGEEPPELLTAQMERWSPVILWFRERFGVAVEPTTGLVSLARPADLETLGRYLSSHSWQALQGFAFGCDALKSLILTVACVERRLTVAEAVGLARLELGVQTQRWGEVEWAHDIELHDTTARLAAAVMFVHFNSASSSSRSKNDGQHLLGF